MRSRGHDFVAPPGRVYPFVMKSPRVLLATSVASVLVIGACAPVDRDDDATSAPTATPDAVADTAEATAGPDDLTGNTEGPELLVATEAPTRTVEPMPTSTGPSGVISAAEAEETIVRLLGAASDSIEETGEEAEELRQQAFAASELLAQRAARRIERLGGGEAEFVFDPAVDEPLILAVSRLDPEDEDSPGVILAQTVPESDMPVLHLAVYNADVEDYRITWQAPMLPGTELPTFERLSQGSPLLPASDAGELFASPNDILDSLVAELAYPDPEDTEDIDAGSYLEELQVQFADQEEAVADFATFSQTHGVRVSSIQTLEAPNGSALLLAVITRDSIFEVISGQQLDTPSVFRALADVGVVYDEATVSTAIFVAIEISEEGPAELIAVREQFVDAQGE